MLYLYMLVHSITYINITPEGVSLEMLCIFKDRERSSRRVFKLRSCPGAFSVWISGTD